MPSTRYLLQTAALLALLLVAQDAAAKCPPGVEFCWDGGSPPGGSGAKNPCWDPDLKQDICNKPKPPCQPGSATGWKFLDDQDGKNDGEIAVLDQTGKEVACGTITVTKTAYYRVHDAELSESCKKQLDETGYVTVTNSCNPEGFAVEGSAGKYFVVMDSDNTDACSKDTDCKSGQVCRTGTNLGTCCVPASPTFLGTFLLVAGEKNRICIHHWCPVWRKAQAQQPKQDPGFITAGCSGINSIHFRVDANARLCEEQTLLVPCPGGCVKGKCLPDPCDEKKCPGGYCKDGVCQKENPCATLKCQYGCKDGRCLQPKSAPGVDADGDGYAYAADCDDQDALVNPGRPEVCANGKDDDCDGLFDEVTCDISAEAGPGSGALPDDGLGASCTCRAGASPGGELALWLLLLLAWGWRRRRGPGPR